MAKLLVANWKMNPSTIEEAKEIFAATVEAAQAVPADAVIVCPPFEYLLSLVPFRENVGIGAQDVFWENAGAYTGEVSPTMLENAGIRYAIIGHSERRKLFGETDEMVNKKVAAALNAGLTIILCVGESKEVRDQGFDAAEHFVMEQLNKDLVGIDADYVRRGSVIVAYEPIWAIGTGVADTPEEGAEMSAAIKKNVESHLGSAPRVLYGGSVNAENVAAFLSRPEIDGALVGGASVKAEEFSAMIHTVQSL